MAPAAGENDAFLIQRSRETDIEEYNEDLFVDAYNGEIDGLRYGADFATSQFDGQSFVKDKHGNVLVFRSVEAANLRAAEEWESMQKETHDGFTPAPEEEQQIATRAARKQKLVDGRVKYSRKQKYYTADLDICDEIKHVAISEIKVSVIKGTLVA
jgi:PHD/YefM family antitoxin component YafN of YafNO toxin-antitoxin module